MFRDLGLNKKDASELVPIVLVKKMFTSENWMSIVKENVGAPLSDNPTTVCVRLKKLSNLPMKNVQLELLTRFRYMVESPYFCGHTSSEQYTETYNTHYYNMLNKTFFNYKATNRHDAYEAVKPYALL
tara:strand:- start:8026 stop:8409 length:384 start_codon:yes stop_codon:yes gene_type:complete